MLVTPIRLAVLALLGTTMAAPVLGRQLRVVGLERGLGVAGQHLRLDRQFEPRSSPDNRTADGDYRVIDVAEVDAKPGMLQLTLQATQGEAHEFTLKLPREALGQQGHHGGRRGARAQPALRPGVRAHDRCAHARGVLPGAGRRLAQANSSRAPSAL